MKKITRRTFAKATIAAGIGVGLPSIGRAQAAGASFLSYSFAEEPNKPHVEKLAAGFKAWSGTDVSLIGTAWGETQKNLLLRRQTKTLPTTVQLSERWLPAIASLPEIVNLDDLIGRSRLESIFDPNALAMSRVGGKTFAVPMVTGSIGMVANTEVLAKAGVSVPTTLEEFRSALLAVRDKVANSVPFAAVTKNPSAIPLDFMILVWAHGGRIIDESGKVLVGSPEAKAALGFMAGLMKDRLIAPELDRPDSRRLFAQGASAFYFDAPITRTFVRPLSGRGNAADAFILPIKSPVLRAGDTPRSIQWGSLIAAMSGPSIAGADSPGTKWLNYLVSDEAQSTFGAALGGLPTTKTLQASPLVQGDPFFKAWSGATGTPLTNEIGIWSNSAELSAILSEEVQAALLAQKTADAAIDSMRSRMEASMAKRG